jgi:hypothetical protein
VGETLNIKTNFSHCPIWQSNVHLFALPYISADGHQRQLIRTFQTWVFSQKCFQLPVYDEASRKN